MSRIKHNRQHVFKSYPVSDYISSGETLPSTVFVHKHISLLFQCFSPDFRCSFSSPCFVESVSSLVCLFCLSPSVFVLFQCFSLSFYYTPSLSVFLSVCLFGIIWLVLIYSHHYLVLEEDKHAFACLMNQTPSA